MVLYFNLFPTDIHADKTQNTGSIAYPLYLMIHGAHKKTTLSIGLYYNVNTNRQTYKLLE